MKPSRNHLNDFLMRPELCVKIEVLIVGWTIESSDDPAQTAPDSLVDILAQSAFMTMGAVTRLAADNDLSLTQLRVLSILRDRRLRLTDLVAYLGLEKSTVTGLISRAEARGLVAKVPNADDRRATDVLLTASGRRLSEELAANLACYLLPATTVLSPSEQRSLTSLLQKIIASVG